MSKKRKLPGIPSHILPKYHHEIKCLLQQFQSNILIDILKNADLTDKAFEEVAKFSDFADTPTGVLGMIKDIKGNDVSKRMFNIRMKEQVNEQ